jgi:hypothetical protein
LGTKFLKPLSAQICKGTRIGARQFQLLVIVQLFILSTNNNIVK